MPILWKLLKKAIFPLVITPLELLAVYLLSCGILSEGWQNVFIFWAWGYNLPLICIGGLSLFGIEQLWEEGQKHSFSDEIKEKFLQRARDARDIAWVYYINRIECIGVVVGLIYAEWWYTGTIFLISCLIGYWHSVKLSERLKESEENESETSL